MPATLATADAITKEVYGPRIVEQLNNEIVVTRRMAKSSKGIESQVGGKYVTFPIRVTRNQGIGYRAEGGQLQDSGQQGWASVRVPLKYGYGRVNLTGPSMELIDSNYQAFASLLTQEMNGLKDDIAKDTNRLLYGNGIGTLATASGAGTAITTFTANNAVATKYLEVGQVVDIVTPGNGTVKASGLSLTAVTSTTATLSASATWASGDVLVRTGNWNKEPQGLSSIVASSGTLFNVDPTTQPKWVAVDNNNGGTNRALTEALMIQTADSIRIAGGSQPTVILTDLGSRRAYFNLLQTQRRYVETKDFAGGFQGLAFNYGAKEIPVVEDVDATPNTMYFLNEDSFTVYQSRDWHWADMDGSVWKWVTNYDKWEALLRKYWEFGVNKRNANGKLSDITAG